MLDDSSPGAASLRSLVMSRERGATIGGGFGPGAMTRFGVDDLALKKINKQRKRQKKIDTTGV